LTFFEKKIYRTASYCGFNRLMQHIIKFIGLRLVLKGFPGRSLTGE
jgi:hypothetical protein